MPHIEPLSLDGTPRLVAGIILGILFGFVLVKSQIAFRKTVLDQFSMKDSTFFKTIFLSLALGVMAFHFAGTSGIINVEPQPSFFWAAEIGGVIFALGIAMCGYFPSSAVAATGAGRVYGLWVFAGMVAAIPVISVIVEFLSMPVVRWPAPFQYYEYLPVMFGNENLYLWIAGGCAVLTLFFEFIPAGGEEKKE